MADLLFRITLSNLCVSTALALVAFVVHRWGRRPGLSHLLWLAVLLKLVTPPVFTIPVIPVASTSAALEQPWEPALGLDDERATSGSAPLVEVRALPADGEHESLRALGWLWLLGSLAAVAVSLARVGAFHRSLRRASRAAAGDVRRTTARLGASLGLRRVPELRTTEARVRPFVWWLGGRVQVVLPRRMLDTLSREELRLLIAHELAHVRRRDHWVRWVEWLAGVAFWWNPVMWWARRNLRVSEELACDSLVLQSLEADRHTYAHALLSAAELLPGEALRPPAVASAVHSGGSLEKRLTMILSNKLPKTPRWLRSTLLVVAVALLPMSLAYSQDYGAVERRLGQAVAAGEITLEQAQVMMEALRRSAGGEPDLEARRRRYMEGERRIKEAVKAGKLGPEDAEKRLIELRERLFGDADEQAKADQRARRARYAGLEKRLKAAVEKGELTPEEAEKKLVQARKEMFGDSDKQAKADQRALRTRYAEYEKRLKAAVKKGELTPEEAEKKLLQARKEMFGDPDKQAKADQRARRERYAKLEKRLKAAVEKGELTPEEAEKKLIKAREDMFGGTRDERKAERGGGQFGGTRNERKAERGGGQGKSKDR